jgi:hypothetical protein
MRAHRGGVCVAVVFLCLSVYGGVANDGAEADAPRAVPGFVGPYFNEEARRDKVVVLRDTVVTSGSTIRGLLRNETGGTIRGAKVAAVFFDAAHHQLARVDAWVPLPSIRRGEPAPFVVQAPGVDGASIEWDVTYTPDRNSVATEMAAERNDEGRSFELDVYWQRPFGQRERLFGYPQEDPADGPYPFVLFGALRNVGAKPFRAARVLGAWLDDEGHVLYVDWLKMRPVEASLRPQAMGAVKAGGAVDFFYSNSDPAIAPLLQNSRLVLWGTSHE